MFAACGGGGGGSGDNPDGGGSGSNTQVDAYVPPQANCAPLDLGSAAGVPIQNMAFTPNPAGGTITEGTFKLTSMKLYVQGITVTGTTKARVEIDTGTATTGAARVAVSIDGTATVLGSPQSLMQDVTGAGLYTIAGSALTVADGCGGGMALPVLNYTATPANLTLWTEYMLTDPIPLTIPLELVFAHE